MNGYHDRCCKQILNNVKREIDQWLSIEISKQLISTKAGTLTGCHDDTACISIWLIEIHKENILMVTQFLQERKLLFSHDHEKLFVLH